MGEKQSTVLCSADSGSTLGLKVRFIPKNSPKMKVDFNDKDQDGKTEFAKVHSFLKQCCARFSVYQNKVHTCIL